MPGNLHSRENCQIAMGVQASWPWTLQMEYKPPDLFRIRRSKDSSLPQYSSIFGAVLVEFIKDIARNDIFSDKMASKSSA